jgi:hypothetical protein
MKPKHLIYLLIFTGLYLIGIHIPDIIANQMDFYGYAGVGLGFAHLLFARYHWKKG